MRSQPHARHTQPCIFQPRLLSVLIVSALAGLPCLVSATPTPPAAAPLEFDPGFFRAGSSAALNLARFARGNVVLPGSYPVQVYMNGDWKGREELSFVRAEGQDSAQPCFDRAMLQRFGVDMNKVDRDAASSALPAGQVCADLGAYIKDASISFDTAEHKLAISIPQLYISRTARGYVSPEHWDSGVPAALLGYRFNTYNNSAGGRTRSDSYLGLNAGVNLGDWHLRHVASVNKASGTDARYQASSTYVQRDLPSWQSQLIGGDTYTSGEQFDSVRVRGIRLATDDRMLPQSQTGYAPVVRGIANSNAKVTVRQRDVVLYETSVAPGPFVIDDLNPTGYGGDLEVTVTEADGQQKQFNVSYAATPRLLREGYTRYSLTAGSINEIGLAANPYLVQATLQHGFNNTVTGYLGAALSQGYTSAQVGAALNTPVGALSLDLTAAQTRIPGAATRQGQSVQARYSKNFVDSGTSFSMGAYRYSTEGYLGVRDAVRLRDQASRGDDPGRYDRMRSRLDLSASQSLGKFGGRLYLSGSSTAYWNQRNDSQNFSFGYNNNWKSLNYGISAQRTRSLSAQGSTGQDTQLQLTLSMPLGAAARTPNMSATFSDSSRYVGLSGNAGERNQYNYGLALNQSAQDGYSGSVNARSTGSVADLNLGHTQGGKYRSTSVGASGGVVLHPGGLTLSQSLGETIGVVHAPDAAGVAISNASGARVDGRGYAVVPYLTPYQLNTVNLDPKGSSMDVELKATSYSVAPRMGAVVMLKYDTVSGRAVLVKARHADGSALPFGADVFDAAGNSVGVVGQASRLMVRGLADDGVLSVKWGEGGAQHCRIAYSLPAQEKGKAQAGMTVIEGRCVGDLETAQLEAVSAAPQFDNGTQVQEME